METDDSPALPHTNRPLRYRTKEVRLVLQGIRRRKGVAPERVRPIAVDELSKMVAALAEDLAGTRDRALLLVGFAGAFRRSELTALDVEDLVISHDGVVVKIRRSKADQEAAGR